MTISQIETFIRKILTKTTSADFPAADILILENKYYEDVIARIMAETAGTEDWGDLNYTAFPTFTISMTDSTREYDLNAISTTPLVILGVEVQDQNGTWHVLKRITLADIHKQDISEADYYSTVGQPSEYLIRDSQIALYPAPDNGVTVTLSNGLKIFYLRTADIFTSAQQSTGTKSPGFPSPYHDAIGYGVASDYWLAKDLQRAAFYERKYEKRVKDLLNFISRRNQDIRPIMSNKGISHI